MSSKYFPVTVLSLIFSLQAQATDSRNSLSYKVMKEAYTTQRLLKTKVNTLSTSTKVQVIKHLEEIQRLVKGQRTAQVYFDYEGTCQVSLSEDFSEDFNDENTFIGTLKALSVQELIDKCQDLGRTRYPHNRSIHIGLSHVRSSSPKDRDTRFGECIFENPIEGETSTSIGILSGTKMQELAQQCQLLGEARFGKRTPIKIALHRHSYYYNIARPSAECSAMIPYSGNHPMITDPKTATEKVYLGRIYGESLGDITEQCQALASAMGEAGQKTPSQINNYRDRY